MSKNETEPMFQFNFDQLARYENGRTPVLLTEEQYRRARACVNVCAGISTESLALEGSAAMGWQRTARKLIDVAKQRDELLASIELIYSWANNWDSEFMNDPEWKNQDYPHIQSVVANAKGTA
jgi:hypothetical protein